MRRRGLLNDRYRVKYAMRALQKLGSAAWFIDLIDSFREKREEHAAEQLIFLEQLVRIEALDVPQLAQLHRLRDDRRVSRHFFRRILDVVGNAVDKNRYVVEEFLSWKNAIASDRHACGDALEPARRQFVAGSPEPIGQGAREWTIL